MRNDELEVNDKHLPLRIIGFALAFIVAVSAFAVAVTSLGHKETGYYEITAPADDETPRYASGLSFLYYLEGSSSQIKRELTQLQTDYGSALKRSYMLLDAENRYEGLNNLASLNQSPGQALELDDRLFAVLQDAAARSARQEGYSLYAGPLYAEWNSILWAFEPRDYDPLFNEEEAGRLQALAEAVNSPGAIQLTVTDEEKRMLRLDVAPDTLALLREKERETVILDLNLLHDAYLLRLTAEILAQQGYTRGYLSTDSGLTLSLSGHSGGAYALYGLNGAGEILPAATAEAAPGSACSQLRAFPYEEGEIGYYSVESGGRSYLRHPNVPAAGEYANALLSSAVLSEYGDVVEACYQNLVLFSLPDGAAVEQTVAARGLNAAWTLQSGGAVHCTGAFSPTGDN